MAKRRKMVCTLVRWKNRKALNIYERNWVIKTRCTYNVEKKKRKALNTQDDVVRRTMEQDH